MRQTRSFVIAALTATLLLLAASFGSAAQESMDAPAAAVETSANSADSTPSRAPLLIVGIGSLGAGAVLLRRAPKLV